MVKSHCTALKGTCEDPEALTEFEIIPESLVNEPYR